ncbi:MAG: DnaJ C-terminal domain-containing protein [Myxococcota bacterium]
MSDLYALLGVARDADEATLRSAYRKLAKESHPDRHPDDPAAEERFKQISQAWAVLSDPERRALYDEFGEASLQAGFDAEAARRTRSAFGEGFGRFQGDAGGGFAFDDLLGSLFGRMEGMRPMPRPGPDLSARLTLDFVEAALGGEHRIQVARPTASGELKHEDLRVRIPPGASDGGRIRLAGKGGESPNGPAGDLWLTVGVRPHPVFRREGRDVHLDLPVSVREAALGAEVVVPTLDGRATVQVPAGSQGGDKLRLRGKGVPAHGGRDAGHLIATLRIRVPRALDDQARRALDRLADCDPEDPRAELFGG